MSKTLFYDVDGVLLDFTGPFINYWNESLLESKWKGKQLDKNPETWAFGLYHDKDDMKEINRALAEFHVIHDHLPMMHEDIVSILTELKSKYIIELVSAYPDQKKRIENLAFHNIPYDKLVCNVNNKLDYIRGREHEGVEVIAIFEDAPHHLNSFLPFYFNKIWAPNYWNYLHPYKNETKIKLYNTPHEWKNL